MPSSNVTPLADARRAAKGDPGKPDPRPARDRHFDALERAGATFWPDEDGAPFVSIGRESWIERHRVHSTRFRTVARLIIGEANQVRGLHGMRPGGVSERALAETLDMAAALALRSPARTPAHRSIAENGGVWIDLGSADWSLARIDPAGWRIVDSADVPLIRSDGTRPLPRPERTTRLAAMRALARLVNAGSDSDLMLMVAWMLAALWPSGPYPVLAIDGEQGSGKSVSARILRELVDANKTAHRAAPRDEDDLIVQAAHARVVSIDNASYINAEMADSLCRLSTGAGFGKRRLFTDGDEIAYQLCRPIIVNGIPSLLARADLADRSLTVTLPPILDEERRDEGAIFADLKAAAPGIVALLFDGIATALRRLPGLALPRTTRMADFCRLVCAAAPAFGWSDEAMLAAIEGNRRGITADVIAADAFADAIQQLARASGDWIGTAADLLRRINDATPAEAQRDRSWPRTPAHASSHVRRAAPALKRAGVAIETWRENGSGRRLLHIVNEPGAPP